jgi:hypothetical protein
MRFLLVILASLSKEKSYMFVRKYDHIEKKMILLVKRLGPSWMRWSLGVIFIWFGLLKIIGISPIEELVRKTSFLVSDHLFVILLGFFEVSIGLCMIFQRLCRLGLILFFLQIPGTFIPLFTNPEDCFTFIPFGLTLEGQYIFKNLVLVFGALYVFSSLQNKD